MTGIGNISSRNISALPQAASKAATTSNFAPLVSTALNAIATTAVPASTVCAVSKEGLGELSKLGRDTYHALGTAANSTASFVNRSIDTVEHDLKAAGQAISNTVNEGIHDVQAAAHYVGEKLSDAEEAISDGVASVAHSVGDAVDAAEGYIGHAVIAGVNAFNKIV